MRPIVAIPVLLAVAQCVALPNAVAQGAKAGEDIAADTAIQVAQPAAGPSIGDYAQNRPPLQSNAFLRLPLNAVKPDGWIKHQLELMAEGMTGHLAEISHFLKPDNGWLGGPGDGWEEQPYWFRGFYDLAVLTNDARLLEQARHWIDAVIATQDADGYFGPACLKRVEGSDGAWICDLWPHMVMIDALIHHYEATGDARIPELLTRFFAFCSKLPDDNFIAPIDPAKFGKNWRPFIQHGRAGDMLPHLYWLYNQTGDAQLLALADRFFKRIAPPRNEWLDSHVINFTQRFSYPGIYATQSGRAWHLDQSEYWYTQHLGTWGQQPRGIFGADENIRSGCVDPRQAFETCGFGEFAKSFYYLGRLTGKAVYADRVEDLIFNHFPASMTPDLKALHYLTASNQPQLDVSEQHEYGNKGRMIDYSPHLYRCCQHNVAMTWPWFVENLWQATPDGGLALWMYGSCNVEAHAGANAVVKIHEATEYPFTGSVKLAVETPDPVRFPLYLRVPRWCNGMVVAINAKPLDMEIQPGHFVRIERAWATGDTVEITMPMEVSFTTWPRTGSVTVDRGPLSYSVKIGERWQRCGGSEAWPEWEVFPTTPWNYGLALNADAPAAGLKVLEKGVVPGQPWTPADAPIEITARAKRIPEWTLVNETADVLRTSPIRSDMPEEDVTLIPLGCARLRMSCLPVIGDGIEASPWK